MCKLAVSTVYSDRYTRKRIPYKCDRWTYVLSCGEFDIIYWLKILVYLVEDIPDLFCSLINDHSFNKVPHTSWTFDPKLQNMMAPPPCNHYCCAFIGWSFGETPTNSTIICWICILSGSLQFLILSVCMEASTNQAYILLVSLCLVSHQHMNDNDPSALFIKNLEQRNCKLLHNHLVILQHEQYIDKRRACIWE